MNQRWANMNEKRWEDKTQCSFTRECRSLFMYCVPRIRFRCYCWAALVAIEPDRAKFMKRQTKFSCECRKHPSDIRDHLKPIFTHFGYREVPGRCLVRFRFSFARGQFAAMAPKRHMRRPFSLRHLQLALHFFVVSKQRIQFFCLICSVSFAEFDYSTEFQIE